MDRTTLRFGMLVPQDAPLPTLVERWRRAEELGFDCVYVADHTADYRNLDGYWLEGWTVLAATAGATSRIRVGTLVSNPILRHPVLLAKEAVAVDQLSGGRLELGIGTGIAGFDHAAMGVDYWQPAERVARFAEYVEVVDGLLRSGSRSFRFAGRWFRTEGVAMSPGPVQRPRPPITVGGQSPTVLRVAAERADCWNTHGPFGAGAEEIFEITARQNQRLDELCRARGRDPAEVRRSLLLVDALDAWASPDALEGIVTRFTEAGVREFVVFWPPEDRVGLLERAGAEVLPRLREAHAARR
jgi:alkanesulfonate monooxygenase SsuD/methylene tetrahydromethanopterin reductase-like flavin-dependent oxidoreductase (luciferase family)